MGTAMETVAPSSTLISEDGRVTFSVPSQFTDVKKSVWEETGYGYFLTNPNKFGEFLVVKVFQATQTVTPELLKERIQADLATHGKLTEMAEENFAGLQWKKTTANPDMVRYYARKESTIYQLQIASDQNLAHLPWVKSFLDSFVIK